MYTQSSNYKEHVTASYTVSAKGDMVPPRVVHSGVRMIAPIKPCISDMPKDGISGQWKFFVSENGWVKHEQMLEIIQDLAQFIDENNIPKLVILFLDGASCHVSLKISELCDKEGIQPILLLPNSTHLLQPLDVTVFSPFKSNLKRELELWQRNMENVGSNLNKYEVVPLVYRITQNMLTTKSLLISKGFRKTGLHPWDPTAPNTDRMKASQMYKTTSTDKQVQHDGVLGQLQVEHVKQVQVESVTQVQLEHVKQVQLEQVKQVQIEQVVQVQGDGVKVPSYSLQTGGEMSSKQHNSHQEVWEEATEQIHLNISTTPIAQLTEKRSVPEDTQRFLGGMEHLLSKQELETFQELFPAGNLTYPNLPYQAWLVMKQGLIPQTQSAALDQVSLTDY